MRGEGAVSVGESHSGLNPTQDAIRMGLAGLAGLAGLCSGFWLQTRQVSFEGEEVGLHVTPRVVSSHCPAHVPCPMSHIPFGYFPSTSRCLVISIFGHLLGIEERAREPPIGKKMRRVRLGPSPGLGIGSWDTLLQTASLACAPSWFVRCDYAKVV